MNERIVLRLTPGPHVRSERTTGAVMYQVILSLLPAVFFGVWRFGAHALLILLSSVLAAVSAEYAFDALTGRDSTIRDGSAAVTGLLLGLSLPPDVPLYIPYVGAAFAAAVVKCLFGGLGKNRLNPALTARCLLALSFGGAMSAFAGASGLSAAAAAANPAHLLIGSLSTVIGGSVIALLLGAGWLICTGVTSWRTPAGALLSYLVFALLFGGEATAAAQLLYFLAGGGMLILFFMAADPVTGPVTSRGKLVYGALIGFLSVLLGKALGPAEAGCLAVLIANLCAPLIDRWTVPAARI